MLTITLVFTNMHFLCNCILILLESVCYPRNVQFSVHLHLTSVMCYNVLTVLCGLGMASIDFRYHLTRQFINVPSIMNFHESCVLKIKSCSS